MLFYYSPFLFLLSHRSNSLYIKMSQIQMRYFKRNNPPLYNETPTIIPT